MAKGSSRRSRSNKPSINATSQLVAPPPPVQPCLTATADDMPSTDQPFRLLNTKIDARPHLEAGAANGRAFGISALAQTTIPIWVQTFVMISLIFGGCCSNVRWFFSFFFSFFSFRIKREGLGSIVKLLAR